MYRKKRETSEEALTYRAQLQVTHVFVASNNDSFPICPRCGITMEREHQSYCDRCGQRLAWRYYSKAKIVRDMRHR